MKFYFLVLVSFLYSNLTVSQVRFIAISDAKQVLTGSSFQVEFRLENAEGSGFQEPDFGGLKKLSGPGRSMSTSIINGRMSSSIGYIYTLVGLSPGKFKIGSARIISSKKEFKTEPLTIEVVKGSNTKNPARQMEAYDEEPSGEIYIEVSVNTKKAFPGQQIFVTTKLFTQVGISHIEQVGNDQPEHCEIEAIGGEYPVQREIYKGKEFLTKVLHHVAIYPQTDGRLIIPKKVYRLILGDDGFGFGLKSLFFNTAKVVESNSIVIDVQALPKPTPANYSGAVGQFKVEFSKLNSNYNLSDALRLNLNITGNGNFKIINPKIQIKDSLLDVLDPTTTGPQKLDDKTEIIKSQNYEFLLTPKKEGVLNLQNSFCYFDPVTQQYIQVKDSQNIQIIKTKTNKLISDNIKLRPIEIQSDRSFVQKNESVITIGLFLLPFIFGFFTYFNKNENNFIKNIFSFGSGKNNKEEHLPHNQNPDAQFLSICKKLIPGSETCNNIFELKTYLNLHPESNYSVEILKIIDEYQAHKYNPIPSPYALEEILNKLNKLK